MFSGRKIECVSLSFSCLPDPHKETELVEAARCESLSALVIQSVWVRLLHEGKDTRESLEIPRVFNSNLIFSQAPRQKMCFEFRGGKKKMHAMFWHISGLRFKCHVSEHPTCREVFVQDTKFLPAPREQLNPHL